MSFQEILHAAWPAALAYVVGATPFGFLAGKMRGVDIREHGSGNIGATNVLRVVGKPVGIAVFVLDVLKGLVPVAVAKLASDSSVIHILTAVGAILGHNYTFWLGFKGGKGIATSAGAIATLMPIPLAAGLVVWLVLFFTLKWVSVASMGAAVALPGVFAILTVVSGERDWPLLGFAVFLAVMALWRHRANIGRLRRGEENKFKRKPKPEERNHS